MKRFQELLALSVLFVASFLGMVSPSQAADWPAYKADASRSGVSQDSIELPLKVQWLHRSTHAPRPAWTEPGRSLNMLDFDYAYQPVVAGGLVVFGSSADDSVRALDAATGKAVWTFVTGGPVRFAPHLRGNRCYVASDDGWAYCLDSKTGRLIWKFRAALDDRRLLANGRMTSRSPCRSGVLVQGDIAFVSAGMWPSEGVFLYALDADTGKVRWCNDTSCYDYLEYPHAPSVSFGGPAPQGYLLFADKTLVVPTGRGAPAAFDAETGKLLHFWSNSPNRGGTWATLAHHRIFVSAIAWQPDQSVRLGESVPHRADSVAALGLRTGKEEWPLSASIKQHIEGNDLPRWRSQVGHGVLSRQRVLFAGKRIYAIGNGKADGFEIVGEQEVKHLWCAPCPRAYSEALARNTLLVGGQDVLVLLDPDTGKTLQEVKLKGQVRGLAVANGSVFASTDLGTIAAFTSTGSGDEASVRIPSSDDCCRGYAVVAGGENARSAQRLAESGPLHVLCLLADPEKAEAEKLRLVRSTALYGTRVSIATWDPQGKAPIPFVSTFANRVLLEGKCSEAAARELYRILRPCGGVLEVNKAANADRIFAAIAAPEAEIRNVGQDGITVVRGPLKEAFDWNSKTDADKLVRWPLEFQWFGDPNGQLLTSRHAKPRTPLPAHGRLFIFGESHVTAVDAYNGSELWRRRLSVGVCTGQHPVSADDKHLYVTEGPIVWKFDAQSGRLLQSYGKHPEIPSFQASKQSVWEAKGNAGDVGELRIEHDDDKLVVRLSTSSKSKSRDDRWELAFDFRPPSQRFDAPCKGVFEVVVDPWIGKLLKHQTHSHPPIAVVMDSHDGNHSSVSLHFANKELSAWMGSSPKSLALAADVKLWTEDFKLRLWGRPLTGKNKRQWPNEAEAWIALEDGVEKPSLPHASLEAAPVFALKPGRLPPMTRSRTDGDFTADFKEGLGKDAPKGKETMLQRVLGFELEKRLHPLTGELGDRDYSRSYGCSGTSCSAAMNFFRSGTIGMYDRFEDAGMRNISGIRSGCGQTLLPAFGMLLYSESASDCLCSYSFATSLAMAPAASRRNEDWALFDDKQISAGMIRRSALNFGAPGDRRDGDDQLWLAFPRPSLALAKKTTSPLPFSIKLLPEGGVRRINTDRTRIEGTDRPWIYGSNLEGLTEVRIDLLHHQPAKLVLSVPVKAAPTIDGDIEDSCWDGFGEMQFSDRGAVAYVRHDDANLYVAYTQDGKTDRSGKPIPWRTSVRQHDGPFDKDDHFRITLLDASTKRLLTFAVTAGGKSYEGKLEATEDFLNPKRLGVPNEDPSWNEPWSAKTKRHQGAFHAEIAIPWKTIENGGLKRDRLLIECHRKTPWSGAKDATLSRLREASSELRLMNATPVVRTFDLKLHFAELQDVQAGERVFSVFVNGKKAIDSLDIAKEAGGSYRPVTRDIAGIRADGHIELRFDSHSKNGRPTQRAILNAVELVER